MYDFVSQKELNGKTYTALRDAKDPRKMVIECDKVKKKCVLAEVWPDDKKILELYGR